MLKLILLAAFMIPAVSFSKDRVGNGGDQVALRFQFEARMVVRLLTEASPSRSDVLIVTKLSNLVNSVKISSTLDELTIAGVRVDAVNYPEQPAVELDRNRWLELARGPRIIYAALVLHESLGAAGFDDSKYELSERLIRVIASSINDSEAARESFKRKLVELAKFPERIVVNRRAASVFDAFDPQAAFGATGAISYCNEQRSFESARGNLTKEMRLDWYWEAALEKRLASDLEELSGELEAICRENQRITIRLQIDALQLVSTIRLLQAN